MPVAGGGAGRGGAWQRRVQAEGDAVVSAELDADDAASGAADADRVSAAVWGGCDPAGSERGGFRRDPEPALYFKWINGIRKGDWGQSFEWQKPVSELIWERLGLTMALSLGALLVGWFIAIPVGVYSATHQYSWLDYLMTTFSFIGLGTPGFLLALIILFLAQSWLGINVGGLFSDEYMLEP